MADRLLDGRRAPPCPGDVGIGKPAERAGRKTYIKSCYATGEGLHLLYEYGR
jgi:hypothetical protein